MVELPVPPSTNNLWRVARFNNKTRVTLSATYRAWLDAAVLLLRASMERAKVYPVAVLVEIVRGKGWHKGRDADNCLKAIADGLVRSQRIEDDSEDYVTEFTVRFVESAPLACVRVSVVPVESGRAATVEKPCG